jgi:hypothetical protein
MVDERTKQVLEGLGKASDTARCHSNPSDNVSTDRLARALHTCAQVVALPGGEAYIGIFERLERDVAQRRSAQDARERARALLNATKQPA